MILQLQVDFFCKELPRCDFDLISNHGKNDFLNT